jgi:diguanylate cyclase (GGDEF)-like protein
MAGASLVARFVPAFSSTTVEWVKIPLNTSAAALACGAGLALSTLEDSRAANVARTSLGALTALLGVASLAIQDHANSLGALNRLLGFSFVSLGIVVVFAQAGKGLKGWASDGALFGAGWVVLSLLTGTLLGALHVFGNIQADLGEPVATALLFLLTLSAAARRAEYGRFSIFVGRGLGSRIARSILPVVMVLPISRELMRARILRHHVFTENYAAACLAGAGTMVALGLLLWISWQFRRLEWEIQSLSLRDELTGLYNLRGFHLLAEHALRMARRSRQPFSVLFVDVDNLKQVNDRLGHAAGSQLLVEAADFLKTQFRETDVLGRIGGDEFGVAGQFSPEAIVQAETRLDALAAQRGTYDTPRLSLSMGHVSTDPLRNEPLDDLLERADAAMYERKKLKKLQAV